MSLRLVIIVLFLTSSVFARARVSGYCEQGGQVVVTAAVSSATTVQASYPRCTITVFYTGGASGTVSTSGTAVTWVSGTVFNANSQWSGLTMTINSTPYTISSCSSTTSCTLTGSAGTQTNVGYSMPSTAPAAIFANNTGTTLGNPFAASVTGYWYFYADNGTYDVQASNGGFPAPVTWGAISVIDPATLPAIITPSAFGTVCAGGLDDGVINTAISSVEVTGQTLYINCTSNVKNIVIPTTIANVRLSIIFAPGAVWNCKNSDNSDCVAANSGTFSTPDYTISGMTLAGGDGALGQDGCTTTNYGNLLHIYGSAVPSIHIFNFLGYGACHAGAADLNLNNIELSDLTGIKVGNASDAGIIGTSITSTTITNLTMAGAASYGGYFTNFQGTFISPTAQANLKYGVYSNGLVDTTIITPYLEANNTSSTAGACDWTIDSSSSSFVSVSDHIINAVQHPTGENVFCMTKESTGINANHTFETSSYSGTGASIALGSGATNITTINWNGTITGNDASTTRLCLNVCSTGNTTSVFPSGVTVTSGTVTVTSGNVVVSTGNITDSAGTITGGSVVSLGGVTAGNTSGLNDTSGNWVTYFPTVSMTEIYSIFNRLNSVYAFDIYPGVAGLNAVLINGYIGFGGSTYNQLNTALSAGQFGFCTNCTVSNCASSGTGAWFFKTASGNTCPW